MTDWTRIDSSLSVQNLCLYDKLNFPLGSGDQHVKPLFACCPYAGPIAIALPKGPPNSWEVTIFMQNGIAIASLTASALFQIFWSKCQKLMLISANGRVLIYDPLGKLQNTFSMGEETLAVGLGDVKMFSYANETGLAVLNSARHIFAINSVNTSLLWRIQDTSREPLQQITCWTIISSPPKQTRVLICCRAKFFHGQQEGGGLELCNFPWARKDGQYLQMEPNHSNSQLLLLHDSKLVQLVDIGEDLQATTRELRLNDQADIGRLHWCAESAFAIEAQHCLLTIYSLNMSEFIPNGGQQEDGNCYTFTFPSPVRFFADFDGIRIFTRHFTNAILPIRAASKAVLGLGSNASGALLFGALEKLEQHSHVAYEFIRSISAEDMPTAIDDCLAAAAHHFDPIMQKKLLKAGSMGMRRCGRPYDSDKFMRICRQLRVLNALRLMGIPLTFTQLEHLSQSSVIDRLVALGHWPMAIRFCNFLEFDAKGAVFKVLAHWCLAMMREYKQRGDGRVDELAQRIIGQMRQYSAIGYADIAEMASRQELPELASILLELETDIHRQVAAMLKLKKLEKALQRATQSQQPDLMHLVLKHLRNSLSGKEVELLLRKVPQALSIYQSEIRDEAPDRLLALYNQNDDFIRQAILYLQRAEESQDIFDASKRIEQLNRAEKALRNMKDVANAQLVTENVQLISENVKREEKYSTSMSHLSVRETFIWAAEHEELALMEQIRKQHRLMDKQVFIWTVEGFARGGKWQQLEQYVRSRKSPMGYLPVVELCAAMGNKNLPLRFMDKLSGYEEQVSAYLILGEVGKAATLAAEKADMALLQLIRRRFPTTSTQWAEVSKIMENLAKSR